MSTLDGLCLPVLLCVVAVQYLCWLGVALAVRRDVEEPRAHSYVWPTSTLIPLLLYPQSLLEGGVPVAATP